VIVHGPLHYFGISEGVEKFFLAVEFYFDFRQMEILVFRILANGLYHFFSQLFEKIGIGKFE
jgi:hypothetical protein